MSNLKSLVASITASKAGAEEKIAQIRDCAAGRRCVILACGPSLTEYDPARLTSLLEGEVVIAIKQAYEYVPSVIDFLVLNSYNYQKYDFSNYRPLVVSEVGPGDPPVYGPSDILLPIAQHTDPNAQLSRRCNFSDFTFDKTLVRPWGPGALYEIGFYLALHIGVKEIVTLGWDIGVQNSPVMPHFYEKNDPNKTRILARAKTMQDITVRNRFLHDNGQIYNKPRIIPEEVDACRDVSGKWAEWMKSLGVDLKIVSRKSIAAANIERVRLEDIVGRRDEVG